MSSVFFLLPLSQKVLFVQFWFIKSGLGYWKKSWGMLITKPYSVSFVVDCPCSFFWWSYRVSVQPMSCFWGVHNGWVVGYCWSSGSQSTFRCSSPTSSCDWSIRHPSSSVYTCRCISLVCFWDHSTSTETSSLGCVYSIHKLCGQVLVNTHFRLFHRDIVTMR